MDSSAGGTPPKRTFVDLYKATAVILLNTALLAAIVLGALAILAPGLALLVGSLENLESQLRRNGAVGCNVLQREIDATQFRAQFEIGAFHVDPCGRLFRARRFTIVAAEPAPQEQGGRPC